ncbi:hypothetical protein WJX74_004312 [Apatococcus lobatus]|uniref:Uncharacterized protein n=1 Tax=Apatococcus lobatus TaxID=904363 RepID=A0AAW1QCE4_9CHLO
MYGLFHLPITRLVVIQTRKRPLSSSSSSSFHGPKCHSRTCSCLGPAASAGAALEGFCAAPEQFEGEGVVRLKVKKPSWTSVEGVAAHTITSGW